MNEKQLELKNKPIHKLLLKYSIPAVVGMMVNALYNVVDRIFIGNMIEDPLAITAVGLVMPFMLVVFGFCMLIGIGGAARISISLGENNTEKANHILGNMLTLIISLMVTISILCYIFEPQILNSLSVTVDTIGFTKSYLEVILIGFVFQGMSYVFNTAMRSEGNPKKAMFTMLIGAGANIILDPIFIGLFKLGIAGAAWATIISQFISIIWIMSHFFSKDSVLKFYKRNLPLKSHIVLSIVSIGMAPFIMQVAAAGITQIANSTLLEYGGNLAIGAVTVINSFVLFIIMPIFGINQGAQPIIGFNYGAKQYQRVKKTWQLAAITATIICTVGFAVAQLFPEQVIRIFNSEPGLIEVGVKGIRKLLMFLPLIGFQIVSANYFQAIGKAPIAMVLSMLRQVIVLIPLLLYLPTIWQLNGIFYAYPISDFIASLVTAIFIFREMNHMKKLADENTANA